MQKMARKPGFTVVELITTLSIIGLLISLMLPAIQNAREAARRTGCKSNLRQLAIAMMSYHDTHRNFPLSSISSGRTGSSTEGLRWNAQLLPFLDQQNLYEKIMLNNQLRLLHSYYQKHGQVLPEASVSLPVMKCPSSGTFEFATPNLSQPEKLPLFVTYASTTDYVAVGGPGGGFGMYPLGDSGWTRIRKIRDITDGLSNTLAIAEHSYPGVSGTEFPIWISTYGFPRASNIVVTDSPINCVPNFSGQFWTRARASDCALSFHPQNAQFAFADGSIHALSETIDYDVYQFLGAIADGQSVNAQF